MSTLSNRRPTPSRLVLTLAFVLALSGCYPDEYPTYQPRGGSSTIDDPDASSALPNTSLSDPRSSLLGVPTTSESTVSNHDDLNAFDPDTLEVAETQADAAPDTLTDTSPDTQADTGPETETDTSPDVADDSDSDAAVEIVEPACHGDIVGVPELGVTGTRIAGAWESSAWGRGLWYIMYTEDPVEMSAERLSIELYYNGTWSPSGPAEDRPHTFAFTGEDYSVCSTCVLTGIGCRDGLPDKKICEREFLAQTGTLTVESIGRAGDRLVGELRNVSLIEVEIDRAEGTFVATPVEGGDTWCIDSYRFDLPIEDI